MTSFVLEETVLDQELREILAKQTDKRPSDIRPESDLVADLDLDSIDFLALFAVLRERYQVKPEVAWVIREMRSRVLRTFSDLAAFVGEVLQKAGGGEGR